MERENEAVTFSETLPRRRRRRRCRHPYTSSQILSVLCLVYFFCLLFWFFVFFCFSGLKNRLPSIQTLMGESKVINSSENLRSWIRHTVVRLWCQTFVHQKRKYCAAVISRQYSTRYDPPFSFTLFLSLSLFLPAARAGTTGSSGSQVWLSFLLFLTTHHEPADQQPQRKKNLSRCKSDIYS